MAEKHNLQQSACEYIFLLVNQNLHVSQVLKKNSFYTMNIMLNVYINLGLSLDQLQKILYWSCGFGFFIWHFS